MQVVLALLSSRFFPINVKVAFLHVTSKIHPQIGAQRSVPIGHSFPRPIPRARAQRPSFCGLPINRRNTVGFPAGATARKSGARPSQISNPAGSMQCIYPSDVGEVVLVDLSQSPVTQESTHPNSWASTKTPRVAISEPSMTDG